MGASDELFRGFIQLLITNLENTIAETDPEKQRAQLESLLYSLRATLEG